MVARIGRQTTISFGATLVGVRELGYEHSGEPIDITSGEDSGVRTLIDDAAAQDEVNISVSGIAKDDDLKTLIFAGTRTQATTVTYPDGATIAGNFFISSLSETEPYQDATTFEATLVSSGTVTYTPAP